MTRRLGVLGCAWCFAAAACHSAFAQGEPDPLCGANTLYVSLKALDADVSSFDDLKTALGDLPPGGYSLGQMADVAEQHQMRTLGVQTTLDNLERRPGRFACIAYVDGSHFVNIADVQDGVVSVVDPPRKYSMPADVFRGRWDGTALLISPEAILSEEDLPQPLPWRWIAGVGAALFVAYLAWYTVWVLLNRKPSG